MKSKRKRWLETAVAALMCLCIGLIVFSYEQNRRVNALTLQVNAAFQKAFYETIELLSGAQLNLEKLLATSSPYQEQALFIAITRQCEGAQDNLSMMPVNNEAISGALKFVNQLGDYARVMGEKLAIGYELTEEDFNQVSILHAHSSQLTAHLTEITGQYERGELVFSAEEVAESGALSLQESTEPAVEYPVLLYDGPFSDATDTDAMKALGEQSYTREQAADKLRAYIGSERVTDVQFTGNSSIPVDCFEYTIITEDGNLDAGVTEQGGEILYILPESGEETIVFSQAECIDFAHRFLTRNGYGEMEISYWRQLDGLLTVNFAAVQEGVLLYPDLVKLQVSMRTGQIVGVEAGNYLRNHVTREFVEIQVTFEDALRRISDTLSVDRTRLCIIPTDAGEVLCWEASAYRHNGDRYLIYIDAVTGQENTILRVTEDDGGVVTQ